MAGSMINRELISRPLTVLLRDEWNQGVTLYVTITLFPVLQRPECFALFFFNDTATTEIYTLSLHDALPIFPGTEAFVGPDRDQDREIGAVGAGRDAALERLLVGPLEVPQSLGAVTRDAGVANFVRQDVLAPRSEEHTSELQSPCNLVCRLLL